MNTSLENNIGAMVLTEEKALTKRVYSELQIMFKSHKEIYITEYDNIRNTKAVITYVGKRFATVILPSGYKLSLNYGSIFDHQNQNEALISEISFLN